MRKQSKKFQVIPFGEKTAKPWGYEILFTPKKLARVGKILFVKAGHRLSLQYHDQKEETLCLISGKAKIWLENEEGKILHLPMKQKFGYTISLGQQHRIEAIEDSLVAEVSAPEKGKTYRVKDDYNRQNENLN